MARYRLLSAHFTEEDKHLLGDKEADGTNAPVTGREVDEDGRDILDGNGVPIVHQGTIVGDGTPHKWTRPPTPEMEGLDAESKRLVEIEKKRGDGLNPVDFLPMTYGQSMKEDADA